MEMEKERIPDKVNIEDIEDLRDEYGIVQEEIRDSPSPEVDIEEIPMGGVEDKVENALKDENIEEYYQEEEVMNEVYEEQSEISNGDKQRSIIRDNISKSHISMTSGYSRMSQTQPDFRHFSKLDPAKFASMQDKEDREEAYLIALNDMKDAIKVLHTKNSLCVQNITQIKRDNETLREQLGDMELECKASEKARELDDNYLLQQEELLSKLRYSNAQPKESYVNYERLKKEIKKVRRENKEVHGGMDQLIEGRIQAEMIIANQKEQIEELKIVIKQIPDQKIGHILIQQLEIYGQNLDEELKERTHLQEMYRSENTNLKNEISELSEDLESLKEDRVKDQKEIFELMRKLGVLQVHYNYDRDKLAQTNQEFEEEEIVRKNANDILSKMTHKLQECEDIGRPKPVIIEDKFKYLFDWKQSTK